MNRRTIRSFAPRQRARLAAIALAAAELAALAGVAAASETGPVIVIPGRRGVPVILNGRDIAGAVVEGDWGLAQPGNIDPRPIYWLWPPPEVDPPAKPYYPRTGRAPGYGRKEAASAVYGPPAPAQSFDRFWGTQSDPTPATIMPPAYDVPAVVVDPGRRRKHPPHHK